ncbi:hypothetical protein [Mycoplasma sp. OR1901]|uniref:hypothetical protein n=1 Tax=Mycoplasma sp. OR1901 TaxID=2742195 RepID=UPI001583CB0E|nr:hypothetical protein [Mycoplasma sp. OR1901]QKT05242.1 hypothetical protein HTZ87_00780 [Mycoplasma sp. OR1901]
MNQEVQNKLKNKKAEVLAKVNELTNEDLKTRLTGILNDTSKQNYNEFAKVYKQVLEGKKEEQRKAKLSEVNALIEQLRNLVPGKNKSDFNNGIETKSLEELETIENNVREALAEELRISREAALEEVKKLPKTDATYNREALIREINETEDIDNLNRIKQDAKNTISGIIDSINVEINKMQEGAKGYLKAERDKIIAATYNNDTSETYGDALVKFKEEVVIKTIEKYNEFKNQIGIIFPDDDHQAYHGAPVYGTRRYHRLIKNMLNSTKAESIEKIDNLLREMRETKDVYQKVLNYFNNNIKNNNNVSWNPWDFVLSEELWNIRNVLDNSSSLETFDDIKRKIDYPNGLIRQFEKVKDLFDMKAEVDSKINELSQNSQKQSLRNEFNSINVKLGNLAQFFTTAEGKTQQFEQIKNKAISLKESLDNTKQKINSIDEKATKIKQKLNEAWNLTQDVSATSERNSTESMNNAIENSENGLRKLVNDAVTEINKLQNPKQGELFTKLSQIDWAWDQNQATVDALKALILQAQREKAREGAENLLARLKENNSSKEDWTTRINNDALTPSQISDAVNEVRNYLTGKQTEAQNAMKRLDDNSSDVNHNTNLEKSNNNTLNESEYEEVKKYATDIMNEEIRLLNVSTSQFDTSTREQFKVNESLVSQSKVRDNRRLSDELLTKYNSVANLREAKLAGARFAELRNNYKTRQEEPFKTMDRLLGLEREINNEINSRKTIAENKLRDWNINPNKKQEFQDRYNAMNNNNITIEPLQQLIDDMNNYNEVRSSSRTRSLDKFVIGRNEGANQITIDTYLLKLDGIYSNKKMYAIAIDEQQHRIVSDATISAQTDDDIQRSGPNHLAFNFRKEKATEAGNYSLERIVYSSEELTDEQVLENTNNVILRLNENNSNYQAFVVEDKRIKASARTMSATYSGYNASNGDNFSIRGLNIKNIGRVNNNSIVIKLRGTSQRRPDHSPALRYVPRNTTFTTSLDQATGNLIINVSSKELRGYNSNSYNYAIHEIEFTADGKNFKYSISRDQYSGREYIDYSQHNSRDLNFTTRR